MKIRRAVVTTYNGVPGGVPRGLIEQVLESIPTYRLVERGVDMWPLVEGSDSGNLTLEHVVTALADACRSTNTRGWYICEILPSEQDASQRPSKRPGPPIDAEYLLADGAWLVFRHDRWEYVFDELNGSGVSHYATDVNPRLARLLLNTAVKP